MAGGGAGSEWYRKLFYRTHTEYNHESSLGIGGLQDRNGAASDWNCRRAISSVRSSVGIDQWIVAL